MTNLINSNSNVPASAEATTGQVAEVRDQSIMAVLFTLMKSENDTSLDRKYLIYDFIVSSDRKRLTVEAKAISFNATEEDLKLIPIGEVMTSNSPLVLRVDIDEAIGEGFVKLKEVITDDKVRIEMKKKLLNELFYQAVNIPFFLEGIKRNRGLFCKFEAQVFDYGVNYRLFNGFEQSINGILKGKTGYKFDRVKFDEIMSTVYQSNISIHTV